MQRCVIIGAGPAGLTAAYELHQSGIEPMVLEQDRVVGGIAKTVEYDRLPFRYRRPSIFHQSTAHQ